MEIAKGAGERQRAGERHSFWNSDGEIFFGPLISGCNNYPKLIKRIE